jgi:segregation and condensation protein A
MTSEHGQTIIHRVSTTKENPETPKTEQAEMPFAIVQGSPITEVPRDLYIPPDALEVFLEAFEGPLDLLLYLIKRQNLDILDIPIAPVTAQYMRYIDLMDGLQLELAGDYLVMAAMLAEIKSRMLLPRPHAVDEEEDPRAELIRRLQEYERYKQAAEDIESLPRYERDIFGTIVEFPDRSSQQEPPVVSLDVILKAFADVLTRAEMFSHLHIQREALSVRERMILILERVRGDEFSEFKDLFAIEEGRAGVIVAFLAVLELLKESLIEMVQNEINGPIYVKAAA